MYVESSIKQKYIHRNQFIIGGVPNTVTTQTQISRTENPPSFFKAVINHNYNPCKSELGLALKFPYDTMTLI